MQSRAMTMYRLAQEMLCSQSTVKKWLAGETMPQRAKLKQLATLFGVSTAYLLGEENEKTATPEGDGYTDEEKDVIQQYRNNPDFKKMVDNLTTLYKNASTKE